MTQPAKAGEPSMEEILASIRRIIAHDDTIKSAQPALEVPKVASPVLKPTVYSPPRAPSPPPAAPPLPVRSPPPDAALGSGEQQSAGILHVTEATTAPLSPPPPPPATPRVAAVPPLRTIDGAPGISSADMAEKPATRRNSDEAQLLSRETSAAVDSAFNSLAQAVLVRNARTLEDLVREMLRPMLKNWLDENLPSLVERLVRTEIERVSRGN